MSQTVASTGVATVSIDLPGDDAVLSLQGAGCGQLSLDAVELQ